MNENDYHNLMFLLNASPDELAHWYASSSDEDKDYAQSLLEVAKAHVIDLAVDKMDEMTDATGILKRFT